MTQEVREAVENLLRSGEREKAIQYLQDKFNIATSDAALLVQTLEREEGILQSNNASPTTSDTSTTLDGALKTEVTELLSKGRQSDALRRVREELNVSFGKALALVREVAKAQNPNTVTFNPGGCIRMVAKSIAIFLMIVSLLFLVVAVVIYIYQLQSIDNSDRVEGIVKEMKEMDKDGSAPVVEFEWQGGKRSYESTFYSSPPDYHQGQRLFLFVDRDDPANVMLDTFADRWALIVGLSVPGAIFLLISIGILQFTRRKF